MNYCNRNKMQKTYNKLNIRINQISAQINMNLYLKRIKQIYLPIKRISEI